MRQYVQSHAQDELLKIYRREYMRRFAWIRVSRKYVPRGVRKRRRKKGSARATKISQRKFVQWLKR